MVSQSSKVGSQFQAKYSKLRSNEERNEETKCLYEKRITRMRNRKYRPFRSRCFGLTDGQSTKVLRDRTGKSRSTEEVDIKSWPIFCLCFGTTAWVACGSAIAPCGEMSMGKIVGRKSGR